MAIQKPLIKVAGKTNQLPPGDWPSGYISRQWFTSGTHFSIAETAVNPQTAAPGTGTLRAFPFLLLRPVTIIAVRVEVTTLLASAESRLGWYTDSGSRYPDALVPGSGALFSAAAIGVKLFTYATPISLPAGMYWQVSAINLGGSYRVLSAAGQSNILGYAQNLGAASVLTCLSRAFTFAALPATFGAGAISVANVPAPLGIYQVQ